MVPESEQELLMARKRTGKIVIEGGTVNASSERAPELEAVMDMLLETKR